jgi:hypothetical protein
MTPKGGRGRFPRPRGQCVKCAFDPTVARF